MHMAHTGRTVKRDLQLKEAYCWHTLEKAMTDRNVYREVPQAFGGPFLGPSRQQHQLAYVSMLGNQEEFNETRREARQRKAMTERALLERDQVRRIQIFNLKYTATAKTVAEAFNIPKFDNGVTKVFLHRKGVEQANRVPASCLHNGSGVVTFVSPAIVNKLIKEAPLREIKNRQVHMMYTTIGNNNVLHVNLYEGPPTKDMRKEGLDMSAKMLFRADKLEMGNWAAPQKFVRLFSIQSRGGVEVHARDSMYIMDFPHGTNRYRFELAYKYVAGKAELHTPPNAAPFLLMSLRIPPKVERLPLEGPPSDGPSQEASQEARGYPGDLFNSLLKKLAEEAKPMQPEDLQWDSEKWIRTGDFTTPNEYVGSSFVYRIILSQEYCTPSALQTISARLKELGVLERRDRLRPIEEPQRNYREEKNCLATIETLSYNVWFHLECLTSTGLLSLQQMTEMLLHGIQDRRIPEEVTCQALSLLMASRTKLMNPVKQFRKMIKDILSDGRRLSEIGRALPNYCMLVHRCTITPTRVVRLPPETELSNRIIRKYREYADHFLRVSFTEESSGLLRLRGSREASKDLVLRISNLLKHGIRVAGRTFQFLAFSTSQLREQSAWCFSPLTFLSAEQIRKEMGNLSDIRCVAKYAARMGQCFSSTVATVEVQDKECIKIGDVTRNGHIFSDGCGLISEELADNVADEMKAQGRINRGIQVDPSAYQLRFGGCKGIVIVYPNRPNLPVALTGRKMVIRPSMEKFTSTSRSIEVVGISRHHPAYLNRQIISILYGKSLGVPDAIFQTLQDDMLRTLNSVASNAQQAKHVLQDFESVGSAELASDLLNMISAGFDVAKEPYLRGLLATIRGHLLQELKNRTRIFVDKAALLMGTMDETGVLKQGQVFLQSNPGPLQDCPTVITGKVIVTKNPCFHPGDIRKLQAVDVPELRHLHNLIVFSSKGPRPPANEISGSDLDGDRFFCCWDRRLIPPRDYPPMDYSTAEPKVLDRDVVIQDVADFFVDHAISDNLGIIANAHLAMTDQANEGVRDNRCLALAQLHSDAVDFPKTGKVVQIPPRLRPSVFPDFMQNKDKKNYVSNSIIGRLFRQIEVPETSAASAGPDDCDEDLLFEQYSDFVHSAWNARTDYEQQLVQIMSQFSVTDEFQLVSGCIIGWDKMYRRRSGKRFDTKGHIVEAVQALQRKFLGIFESELREDYPDADLRRQKALEKASAWYYVTYHPAYRNKDTLELEKKYHLISFAWVPGSYLTELKRRKQAKTYDDA